MLSKGWVICSSSFPLQKYNEYALIVKATAFMARASNQQQVFLASWVEGVFIVISMAWPCLDYAESEGPKEMNANTRNSNSSSTYLMLRPSRQGEKEHCGKDGTE